MSPEEIVRQLKLLMGEAIAIPPGTPPRFTVEQGHLLEFTIGVIENMIAELKKLRGDKS